MALASTTVWECNTSATAANVCGGGFNPSNASAGLDYTLLTNNANYPAAKYSFTDLASTAASSWLVVTSASHTFDTNDPGNIIHINTTGTGAHFTTGLYEIVSVSGGAATLDRACGSVADASGGSYQIGGAMSLKSNTGFTDINFNNALVAGNKVWIKAGTYALAAQFANGGANGTATAAIVYEGYNATRGDVPTGSSRPQFTGGIFSFGNYTILRNTMWSLNSGSSFQPGPNSINFNNKFVNTNQAGACVQPGNYSTFISCEFVCTKGSSFTHTNQHSMIGCYFHDSVTGVSNGDNGANYGSTYIGNIFENCTTVCLTFTAAGVINDTVINNTFIGCNNTGTGIKVATGSTDKIILNNIFYNLGTGINITDSAQSLASSMILENWNNFYSNTTDVVNLTKGANDVAVNPTFVNIAQLTGTGGTVSGSTLTITSATGVVANQDYVNIISGTGATTGLYAITGVAGNVLTLGAAPGGSGTNIVYQIAIGHNATPTANVLTLAAPTTFPGGLLTNYESLGAVQPQYTDAGSTNVKLSTTYVFASTNKTGSYAPASTGGAQGFIGPKRVGQ